jgi:lysozyme
MLIRYEGLRLKPYRDAKRKLTIGVGRNLDDAGITRAEALMLLDNDIATARRDVKRAFPWLPGLDPVRKDVVLNMVFNLGLPRFRRFKKTIASIRAGDWENAAREMLKSRWANQAGKRATELAAMMERGKYEVS